MKKEKKATPEFKTEVEEQQFWSTQDSTDYVDWDKAEITIFPNLRPTLKTISLRLPEPMLNRLKQLVDERDVPYQSLLKIFLKERPSNSFWHFGKAHSAQASKTSGKSIISHCTAFWKNGMRRVLSCQGI